jgi:hypothetical protein
VVDRWLRSGGEPAPTPGSLWQSSGAPRVSGGVPARDSLLAAAQTRTRVDASGETPPKLLPRAVALLTTAFRLRRRLSRVVPERPRPAP